MRALALFSGGLDSILSVKLIQDQGIEVVGVCFESPFFSSDKAARSARNIELPLKIMDITDELLKAVLNPRHGYGNGMNPCIDCHQLMFKMVGEMLKEEAADFMISGEVVGQRPMSQNLRSLSTIAHGTGFKERILRPLSAKLLPETLPEKQGWVRRENLLGLSGRSRKPQIELARSFGVAEYPSPAGGCLLTEKVFSRRLKDLVSLNPGFSRRDVEFLKVGRHFRLSDHVKIVVGRNRMENEVISSLREERDTMLRVESIAGPTALAIGELSADEIASAAAMTASYSDASPHESVTVRITRGSKDRCVLAEKREKSDFIPLMI